MTIAHPIDLHIIDRKSTRAAIKLLANKKFADLALHPYADLPVVTTRHMETGNGIRVPLKGQILNDVLHEAIESLRPTGEINPHHKSWRPYLLITRQYLQGQDREQIAKQLAIDLDTYNHGLAETVDAIGRWLHELSYPDIDSLRQPPSPALHTAPPRTRQRLFGRDDLLQQIKTHLLMGQDVALFGLPGVGKSTLLTALAYDDELLTYFSDGVLWAGLGQNADPFLILGEWAMHLGLPRGELTYLTTLEQRMAAVCAAICFCQSKRGPFTNENGTHLRDEIKKQH